MRSCPICEAQEMGYLRLRDAWIDFILHWAVPPDVPRDDELGFHIPYFEQPPSAGSHGAICSRPRASHPGPWTHGVFRPTHEFHILRGAFRPTHGSHIIRYHSFEDRFKPVESQGNRDHFQLGAHLDTSFGSASSSSTPWHEADMASGQERDLSRPRSRRRLQ